jgi:outer membrane receptor for ferrienterochelin and colicins
MSVNYGTDAAGGVINIITKKPDNEKVDFGAVLFYETNGQYNLDAWGGTSFGKSSVLASGGRNFFDGWSEIDTSRSQQWKPKEQYFGDLKYRLNLKSLLIGYQLSAFHETITDKGAPRFTPYAVYAFDTYYKTSRITNQANSVWMISPDRSLSTSIARSDYKRTKNTYRKDLVELSESLVPGTEEQDTTKFVTYNLRSTYNKFKEGDSWNFQGGMDLSHETASGSRFTESKESIGDYALFGSAEYIASTKVTLRPAMRMTYNTHFKAPVIPSFSIRYNPVKDLAIRFSYGKGFRAPGVKELYLYFVDINHNVQGNENLIPEYSDNFFFSAAQQVKAGPTVNLIKFSAFYNTIRNMITLAQPDVNSSLYTYINIGKFSTHGGSIENTMTWKSLAFTAGVGLTGRYNLYADSGDFKKYIYSTDAYFSLDNNFKKYGVWAGVQYKFTGALPGYRVEADNTITQFTNESYGFLDASVRKSLFDNSLMLTAGVKNILDITSITAIGQGSAHTGNDNSMAVGTGRAFFVKLQYHFR